MLLSVSSIAGNVLSMVCLTCDMVSKLELRADSSVFKAKYGLLRQYSLSMSNDSLLS